MCKDCQTKWIVKAVIYRGQDKETHFFCRKCAKFLYAIIGEKKAPK